MRRVSCSVNSSATTTALVAVGGTLESDRMLLTAEYDTARSTPRAPARSEHAWSVTSSKSPKRGRIFPGSSRSLDPRIHNRDGLC
jgi:hypothetical protein